MKLLVLATVSALAACSGGGGSSASTGAAPSIAPLAINPTSIEVLANHFPTIMTVSGGVPPYTVVVPSCPLLTVTTNQNGTFGFSSSDTMFNECEGKVQDASGTALDFTVELNP